MESRNERMVLHKLWSNLRPRQHEWRAVRIGSICVQAAVGGRRSNCGRHRDHTTKEAIQNGTENRTEWLPVCRPS